MSVYTAISSAQIECLIKPYGLGTLVSYRGISSGIENSNYFITLQNPAGEKTEYVLTIFERLHLDELPVFVQLTTYLNQKNCPVPCPVADQQGVQIKEVANKPAVIVPKAKGEHCELTSISHCEQIGRALAKIHLAAKDFKPQIDNPHKLHWLQQSADTLQGMLNKEESDLLNKTLQSLQSFFARKPPLPGGIIHGDLFRDNVLFADQQLSALIDFYNACHDDWLYDVAITVNDWCSNSDGSLDAGRSDAFLTHYQAVRPFTAEEKTCWSAFLLMAACRFWVSRLLDWHHPDNQNREEEMPHPITVKDPVEFQRIVADRLT
ncbi:MAG: homoserine kinase [Pseudomonadales bacterium]|nr:homoserine kinase [Pseudomonadales bacterium]